MGKRNKEELTAEMQLQLMLENTKLAEIYEKDPDKDVSGHPIRDRVKENRKKDKKKNKKKHRKNGLELFTAPEETGHTKGSDVLFETKSGRRMDKALGKAMNMMRDTDDSQTYHEDPRNEELADRISAAVFANVEEPEEESKPLMVDSNTVSLVSLDLISGKLQVRDLDGNVVMTMQNNMKSQILVEMLKEVLQLAFSTEPMKDLEKNAVQIKDNIPEPSYIETEDDIPIVSAAPEEEEEETFEMEEEDKTVNEENTKQIYQRPSSKPLTSRLPIPKEMLSQNQSNGLSDKVSDLMDQDKFKESASPAAKGRILINPVFPEDA